MMLELGSCGYRPRASGTWVSCRTRSDWPGNYVNYLPRQRSTSSKARKTRLLSYRGIFLAEECYECMADTGSSIAVWGAVRVGSAVGSRVDPSPGPTAFALSAATSLRKQGGCSN